jgi:hypothetical protein
MWGDHLHHGYYGKGEAPKSNTQAQIDMIEEVLKWAGVEKVSKVHLPQHTPPLHVASNNEPKKLAQLIAEPATGLSSDNHLNRRQLRLYACKFLPVSSGRMKRFLTCVLCRWWTSAVAWAPAAGLSRRSSTPPPKASPSALCRFHSLFLTFLHVCM